jgi:GDP-L-fucose synthase
MPGSDDTPPPGLAGKRVWVAGHTGMVGSALVRRLARESCQLVVAGRDDLDLRQQRESEAWIATQRPDVVIVAAARVGGIIANRTYPADFLYDNAMIALNVIHAAHAVGVERLLWLGSSCIYPREASQPIREDALLTGPLEPTNEAYAIAKIAGLKLAEAYAHQFGDRFFTAMPTNLYGPGDNFDPELSHVIPAMIRRIEDARRRGLPSITIWGSGRPLREFLHVDDLADACIFLIERHVGAEPINIGSGEEISIHALARLIADIAGYDGDILCDASRPDGTPRKRLDTSRLDALGWAPSIALRDGLRQVYDDWRAKEALSGREVLRA